MNGSIYASGRSMTPASLAPASAVPPRSTATSTIVSSNAERKEGAEMADEELPSHELDQYRATVRDSLAAAGLREVAFVKVPTNEDLESMSGLALAETLI